MLSSPLSNALLQQAASPQTIARVCASKTARHAAQARRLIVFMVGPVTHSEMRVTRKLSGKLNRDIVLGGTGVVTPAAFLQTMRELAIGALVEVKGSKQTHGAV